MHDDAARLELLPRAPTELVVPERGEQMRLVREKGELHRRDAAPAPACCHSSNACAISPVAGTRSTRAKRIHSTCPTTAARMTESVHASSRGAHRGSG